MLQQRDRQVARSIEAARAVDAALEVVEEARDTERAFDPGEAAAGGDAGGKLEASEEIGHTGHGGDFAIEGIQFELVDLIEERGGEANAEEVLDQVQRVQLRVRGRPHED